MRLRRNGLAARTGLYAFFHFWVDFACILLVTGPLRETVMFRGDWMVLVLVYNAFAFAFQLPFGVLADRLGKSWRVAGIGAVLVAAGWCCRGVPLAACIAAGIGNALFHLGGGREVLLLGGPKAAPSGVFVSTGAVGVFLGLWCARTGKTAWPVPVLLMMVAAGLIFFLGRRPESAEVLWKPASPSARKTGAVFLLAATVALRSWLGGQMAFPWKTGWLALAVVLCVAGGKAIGGILGDRLGWMNTAGMTLFLAALCFFGSFAVPGVGLAGALLFNTTMPITLGALARLLGAENCGLAFGITTFSIFVGLSPDFLTLPDWMASPLVLGLGAFLSLLLLLGGLTLEEKSR